MNINEITKDDLKKVNLKTVILLFLLAVICAALAGKVRVFFGTAVILSTCFPLTFCCGRPFLQIIKHGFIFGTAATLIVIVIGTFLGHLSVKYFLYSLFCGILLLCSFACLLRFMPEKHARRTVSLLFMYIALAGTAA